MKPARSYWSPIFYEGCMYYRNFETHTFFDHFDQDYHFNLVYN